MRDFWREPGQGGVTDIRDVLKPLQIHAVCLSLAVLLGFLLAQPFDIGTGVMIGSVLLVLGSPLLIRYHYPFMLLAWNMGAMVFFLPGHMGLGTAAIALSFAISFTHRILDNNIQPVSVPQLTYPLLALAVVVIATAVLRGGFGLRSFGSENMGGRRYMEILMAILGYFALTARPIPRERVGRYLALFYLSGVVGVVAVVYGHAPRLFNFIYLFIPLPPGAGTEEELVYGLNMGTFRPLAWVGFAIISYLLARYGIRRMFTVGRKHLLLLLGVAILLSAFSGSRLVLVITMMTFAFQFWFEGLHRTKLVLICGLPLILVAAMTVLFAAKLPLTVQRVLAVFPLELDSRVRMSAEGSSEWRREIWRVTIPQIPEYLLLGKGYAISSEDYNFMTDSAFFRDDAESRAATIAGDYHNGPLSVVIPLGIWGVIAFLWVLGAGLRVLWYNHRYGDSELRVINTYLLTAFLVSGITFIFAFGGLYSGMVGFTGIIGLGVSLNGGVARPQTNSTRAQGVHLKS